MPWDGMERDGMGFTGWDGIRDHMNWFCSHTSLALLSTLIAPEVRPWRKPYFVCMYISDDIVWRAPRRGAVRYRT